MPGQRLVGWIKSVASPDTTPFEHHFTGYSYSIQIRSACPRNFNLPARSWLRIFHLDEKDPVHLAGLHFGDARRHRTDNGNVSLRAGYGRIESCRVRCRFRSSLPQAFSTIPRRLSRKATLAVTGGAAG